MTTMTRIGESTAVPCLLLAFELGRRTWKLGFAVGIGQRPRLREIPAGAVERLAEEITRAKARWQVPAEAPVRSCYEAGRDGFWLHRYLVARGVTNYVIDSSSIEVNRRARRAKTDRLDLGGLLSLLGRYVQGDPRVWHVVRVPSVDEEDARHLHRTWEMIQHDRNRLINRLKGLLATHGVALPVTGDFLTRVHAVRLWDGASLPPGLCARLARVWAQLTLLTAQLRDLATARAALQPEPTTPTGPVCGATANPARNWIHRRLAPDHRDFCVARDCKWAPARGVGRLGAGPVPERGHVTRSGHHARGESARAAPHDSTRVELVAVPTGQRVEPLVSRTI